MGKGTSISDTLAPCLQVLQKYPDLKHQLTAMSTQIEGPLDRCFDAVQAMHKAAATTGIGRIYTTITVDDRRDKEVTLESKVSAVRQKLNR
jgi:uncharacterized protein (TIGR00106 family)